MSITDVKVMTCVNQTNNVKSIFVKILLRLNTYKESKTFKRKMISSAKRLWIAHESSRMKAHIGAIQKLH